MSSLDIYVVKVQNLFSIYIGYPIFEKPASLNEPLLLGTTAKTAKAFVAAGSIHLYISFLALRVDGSQSQWRGGAHKGEQRNEGG